MELPEALNAAWVSDTGTVLLSPPLVATTKLGVLVRGTSGRCPPIDEVLSAERRQNKMVLFILSYKGGHALFHHHPQADSTGITWQKIQA